RPAGEQQLQAPEGRHEPRRRGIAEHVHRHRQQDHEPIGARGPARRFRQDVRPKSAPTGFIRERWARHVLPGGAIDRRYYELCVLSELRDRLRAGDVWVVGSRRYRSFEERLISRETQQELQQSGTLPIAVDADFERFIAGRGALLDERLAAIELKAKGGSLPDVTIERGVLKI